jgi:hypothetical protein
MYVTVSQSLISNAASSPLAQFCGHFRPAFFDFFSDLGTVVARPGPGCLAERGRVRGRATAGRMAGWPASSDPLVSGPHAPGNGGFGGSAPGSGTNDFSYVNEFLDAFENGGYVGGVAELTAITPRAYGTPSVGFGAPLPVPAVLAGGPGSLGTPAASDRRGSPAPLPSELYSPYGGGGGGASGHGGLHAGAAGTNSAGRAGDKPTPLRQAAALAALGDVPAESPLPTPLMVPVPAAAADLRAVQGASSLLSLRTGMPVPVPSAKTHERFLLTAADPVDGANDEARLLVVLQAKYEAGLIKPYDYGAAYARIQRYMETRCVGRPHASIHLAQKVTLCVHRERERERECVCMPVCVFV